VLTEQGRIRDSSAIVLWRQSLLGASPLRTPTERKLADIRLKALDMDQVGVADAYEDLGANSLLTTGFFAEIEQTFHVTIQPSPRRPPSSNWRRGSTCWQPRARPPDRRAAP
jgi:hypothetical protein